MHWIVFFHQTCFLSNLQNGCLLDISLFSLFCFSVYNLNISLPTMMTSRWGENREGHNPGTVLLVSVESQNTARLCCGFHLIILMSRKKQSPILRLAHNYRSRRNIGICLESNFGNGGNKVFFWNTKRFICFKKGKTRRDIKIGSGFCKIS